MNIEQIRYWNSFVINRFVYTEDKPINGALDDWKSWARPLLSDNKLIVRDDCDGLASTVAELLWIHGARPVWRVMVAADGTINNAKQPDHMVALVADDTGQRWIVGDTFNNFPVRFEHTRHKIFFINDISDGISWVSV